LSVTFPIRSSRRASTLDRGSSHTRNRGTPTTRRYRDLVWLFVVTVGVAVVVVIVTRGDFRELLRLRVSGVWLLFAGLGIQIALEFVEFDADQIETVGYGVLMVSYAFILSFCFANLNTRGFGVIAVGIAMNALVIGLNQGMPTIGIGNDHQGNRIEQEVEQTVKHRPESDDDLVGFLGDTILLPEPFDTVVSFGDLIMAVGICELAYSGSRRRWRRGGQRDPMVQWRDSSTSRR
jgi:hypothetical protein